MLKTMKQLLQYEPWRFVLDMNPLLLEVQDYIDSDEELPSSGMVFGMQLLVESFKSFLLCGVATKSMNCRTVALKFALEVKTNLNPVMENMKSCHCRCVDCSDLGLDGLLRFFEKQLHGYLSETRFDLYYQTPWVVGQHMQEMFSLATDYGLRLWDQHNYVAAALHLYNMLSQLGTLEIKIPVLESLCEAFKDHIFLGSRPSTKYETRFKRFLGGRVKFDETVGPHDRTWRLETPSTTDVGTFPWEAADTESHIAILQHRKQTLPGRRREVD